jgi:sugar transferase (PEP-CTERM/EpsH1 system associated)
VIDDPARGPAASRPVPEAADRPRIVHVIPTLRTGGLEKMLLRLITDLAGEFEHVVVTPSRHGSLTPAFSRVARVVALGESRAPDRWMALRMARLLRALRPRIVHSRNWTCIDAIIAARLAGVRTVIHGEHGRDATDADGRNRVRRRVRRALALLVTEFTAVSRDLARWLVEDVGVPARKVRHIPNGVDAECFAPRQRDAARHALDVPPGAAVIGTVGRLDPVKDHVGLIRGFAAAIPGRSAVLVITGDGPCRARIEDAARELGVDDRVRVLGERDDVPTVLNAFDLFVLPSLGEGMSNAVLEAMATGLPVLATRIGGNSELVVDDVTGTLVPRGSHEALVGAMRRYVDHPELMRAHGRAGRVRVEAEFTLATTFGAYRKLYHRQLGATCE